MSVGYLPYQEATTEEVAGALVTPVFPAEGATDFTVNGIRTQIFRMELTENHATLDFPGAFLSDCLIVIPVAAVDGLKIDIITITATGFSYSKTGGNGLVRFMAVGV